MSRNKSETYSRIAFKVRIALILCISFQTIIWLKQKAFLGSSSQQKSTAKLIN
jgi:hypothetical protein